MALFVLVVLRALSGYRSNMSRRSAYVKLMGAITLTWCKRKRVCWQWSLSLLCVVVLLCARVGPAGLHAVVYFKKNNCDFFLNS